MLNVRQTHTNVPWEFGYQIKGISCGGSQWGRKKRKTKVIHFKRKTTVELRPFQFLSFAGLQRAVQQDP